MSTIAIPLEDVATLHALATGQANETCAYGFVQPSGPFGVAGYPRYVIHGLTAVPEAAYLARTPVQASLAPEFILELANRARAENAGVAVLHTHPGTDPLEGFSGHDDAGEVALRKYFESRLPGQMHIAGVVTAENLHLRRLGHAEVIQAVGVGPDLRACSNLGQAARDDLRYDRQIRAFGRAGQARLRTLRVAIVGLGGTGSFVANQLAHLGVGHLVLIDHDVVDLTNLNRLLGATPGDVGRPKVDVARRCLSAINPDATVESVVGDVVDAAVAARLLEVDFVFGCTDSMASRAVINQVAYQHLVPAIDMGVAIHVRDGHIKAVTGRVQMLSPGLGCLVCADGLDGNQIRWELMTPVQRRADPYFENASVPQPAVMPLNGVATSAAVSMFLAATTGYPGDARLLHFDGMLGSMRPQILPARAGCIVCSSQGALARGNGWPLPVRQETRDE